MTIKFPFSLIKEFLETSASPQTIAQTLTNHGPSVEKIEKTNGDTIFTFEITTNRPDLLGAVGIAREAAAALEISAAEAKFIPPKTELPQFPKIGEKVEVNIKPQSLCPRYAAVVLKNIKIGPSPAWLTDRLEACGIRSLNNVIDISNYVMLALGAPNHAFDWEQIGEGKILIRQSREGESLTLLDGKTYKLPVGSIVMEDGTGRLIDLLGIMGAQNSAVTPATKTILFTVEINDPAKIRKTSMSLGLRTEAAIRFEKGLSPEGVTAGMSLGLKLLQELAKARPAGPLVDIYPNPWRQKQIVTTDDFIRGLIGAEIKDEEISRIFKNLEFDVKEGDSRITVGVPSFRNDIQIPEDLVEEVARIIGFENIPSTIPDIAYEPLPALDRFFWERKIVDTLTSLGFFEIKTNSMVSKEILENFGFKPELAIPIRNPLSSDLELMRPTLIPSVLGALISNLNIEGNLGFFEMARIYSQVQEKEGVPRQPVFLLAVSNQDFNYLKGILESLLAALGIEVDFKPAVHTTQVWHPARTAIFEKGQKVIGTVGEIDPNRVAGKRISAFEINFEELLPLVKIHKTYKIPPKYPPHIEDLAFVFPSRTLTGEVIKAIKKADKNVAEVGLLDSYNQTRTFRITYQSASKTLSDKDVEKIRKKIVAQAEARFQGRLKE